MTDFDANAFEEGRNAAKQGKTFDDCPYLFCRVGVTQEVFDREYRAKLRDWYLGWKENTEWKPSAAARREKRKP